MDFLTFLTFYTWFPLHEATGEGEIPALPLTCCVTVANHSLSLGLSFLM